MSGVEAKLGGCSGNNNVFTVLSSNTSYGALDGFTVLVIPFLMVVSFIDFEFQLKKIYRFLSIYTLFDCTPGCINDEKRNE
jgi:hypothetical protein